LGHLPTRFRSPWAFTTTQHLFSHARSLCLEIHPGLAEKYGAHGRPAQSLLAGVEWLAAHEVAHQWWFGVVGNDQIDEPWLDEALTQYSTMLYYEKAYGPERAAGILRIHRYIVSSTTPGVGVTAPSSVGLGQPGQVATHTLMRYTPSGLVVPGPHL
jgi:hypothetical protein